MLQIKPAKMIHLSNIIKSFISLLLRYNDSIRLDPNNFYYLHDKMFLKTTSYISALLLTLTLTGCYSPKPQATDPLFTVPENFSKTGQTNVQTKKWWQDFNDPQLNKLIKLGLENNFSLQATFHRLEQAKASCAGSSSDLLPSLGTENK